MAPKKPNLTLVDENFRMAKIPMQKRGDLEDIAARLTVIADRFARVRAEDRAARQLMSAVIGLLIGAVISLSLEKVGVSPIGFLRDMLLSLG